jgi:hypothetical protein
MSARTIAAGLIGGALITASLLGAGTASADATTDSHAAFIEHVKALGFDGGAKGDTSLVEAGTKLCDAMDNGVSLAMVQALAENTLTPKGYSISDADRFVAYVVSDLC